MDIREIVPNTLPGLALWIMEEGHEEPAEVWPVVAWGLVDGPWEPLIFDGIYLITVLRYVRRREPASWRMSYGGEVLPEWIAVASSEEDAQ